ncbi:hydro-lyase, Fe-S type, tartrate/fumarate subfamily [Sphaerochaeta pleomorpha str. Grapes]|uniref:Hydro-lyase, Fe-S type, tartrate/fumarate subfamily n=1 Tax=Sphaerochaeta pleomorpha (strain ATCC BAA-1885 / DSM 22778 / Grapes) TaxID=158190 RepID=G8QU26_SPHPG|nr:fumarate hydratase [Sphaerochaeta pleomorpha]AEV30273.1 hydro-lyase, Fe-S type, tartrate/fumarate subfamily [Sphaerochaeta pleomorpha str. Grapes]
MTLSEKITEALRQAVVSLSPDVLACLDRAIEEESKGMGEVHSDASLMVLQAIKDNLEIASQKGLPMCQDTGMFVVFVDLGRDCPLSPTLIEKAIKCGCLEAVQQASFRRSVVAEPVFERKNTTDNLPPVISWKLVDGSSVAIHFLLKGFGSENCSSVRMLNPTGGSAAVVDAVEEIVRLAGGKPCPPIFLGVGLGGTMERAALLSKRALLRDSGKQNANPKYASLEQEILDRVQNLHIGSGGFGGRVTALNVAVEYEPTHIAALPLAVSINCWADRKATVIWEGEDA